MRLGFRGRLFALSVALLLVAGLASGFVLDRTLRPGLENQIRAELRRHALAGRAALQSAAPLLALDGDPVAWAQPIALRLAEATSVRVTVVWPDGAVVADSELPAAEVRALESHATRPEILAAFEQGEGQSMRYSETLRATMAYAAVRLDGPAGPAVVRAAVPLPRLEDAVSQLRGLLVFAGVAGLAVAALMSVAASWLAARDVRALVENAQRVARGERGVRVPVGSRAEDELGRIGGSINRLAEGLEGAFGTLASERDRFGAVLDAMGEAVVALDGEQRITLLNRAAIELFGVEGEVLGRPLLEVIRVPEIDEVSALALGGGEGTVEASLPGELESEETIVLARARPLPGAAGAVLVLLDVTSKRRLERVRKDFVANVSHELRTPVSAILATAETLQQGALEEPEHASEFVDSLARNAGRLSRLIGDLLDLSRVESGTFPLDVTAVELTPAVAHAVSLFESPARAKELVLVAEPAGEDRVLADPGALEQVLGNLLDNAVKYTPAGGRVAVRSVRAGERVRIEVVDDGPGVPVHQRGRLFERFYRVDPGRSRALGGTGLGLAIVKHLVESMGGEVGMEPGPERGSVFWFALRIAP